MTYKLNPIIEKIESSVLLHFPDKTVREYGSGTEAGGNTFEKNYQIEKITAEGSTVIIELEENYSPATMRLGEEQSFF